MKDEIIKDFEIFIKDLCGEEIKDRKTRKELEKWSKMDLRDIQDFMRYRDEMDSLIGRCHKDTYICQKCGEFYEIFFRFQEINWEYYLKGRPPMDGEDLTASEMEMPQVQEIKRTRNHCSNCGDYFITQGDVQFIRNVPEKGTKRVEYCTK